MQSPVPNRNRLIIILGFLTAIGPFSIDMYLPAFPEISSSLDTTMPAVMLSLSSFFIGISLGQLFYGPLLERYGRKKPLYAGLLIYLVASIGCATAQTIEMLVLFRLFQAFGGCVGMVASRAIVRDLFSVQENARIFSSLMLIVAVSPIIAPTAGGYITHLFGWRAIFITLIVMILLILAGVHYLLPESRKGDSSFSLKPVPTIKNYYSVLRQPQFLLYVLTGAIAYSSIYAYISGSPHVFMEHFKVSEKTYGWIFALIAMGLIGASQVNNHILKKYSSQQVIATVLYVQFTIGSLFFLLSLNNAATLPLTILLIFCFLCCLGFVLPNAAALALAPFEKNAGNAAALIGFLQMSFGALASALLSRMQTEGPSSMAAVMTGCTATGLLILQTGIRIQTRKASKVQVAEEEIEMINTL